MGNQNNSVARKRLSTLAITTTLAAVGVGVVGTGAANAATNSNSPLAHSQGGQQTAAAPTAVVNSVTPGTGLTSLTASADLTGTTVDPSVATGATAIVTWDSGTKGGSVVSSPIGFDAKGMPTTTSVTNTYLKAGTYNVTVEVTDGNGTKVTSKDQPVTVTDATLKASLSTKTSAKNSPVVLSLAGTSVDKSILGSDKLTVDWGDKTAGATFTGDLAMIKATDPKLSHSYTADGTYNGVVKLDDGLGNVQPWPFTVTVSEKAGVQVLRAAGDTRYGTGLIISQHQWASTGVTTDTREQAKSVVLATGDDFADALVAVPFAKKAQGPLLLTDGSLTKTNPDVLKEIQRILPTKGTTVYIVGGEKAISADIQAEIAKLGYTVDRLSGQDRFATSVEIAKVGMGDPSHIIVARGDEGDNHNGFADALAAGSYAANVFGGGNSAVVLSNNTAFDPATGAYVTSKLKAGQQNVAAVGGQAATAMTTIKGSAGTYVSAVGATRYETAAKVAAAFLPAGKADQIGVATGLQFPDALTGGAEMATLGGPLLLTDPSALSTATAGAISSVATTTPEINIFGGEKAVTPAVANAIAALVKVTTIGKF